MTPATVAVGETFTVVIEVYAQTHSARDVIRLHDALEQAGFSGDGENAAYVAAHDAMGWQKQTPAGRLWLGEQTYSFRATAPGPIKTPTWRLSVGDAHTTVSSLTGLAYAPDAAVRRAAVLPIVAERQTETMGRSIRRSGSAFAVGPDALVTSFHVVGGAHKVWITLPNGRRITTRRAWVVDPDRDVIVLHVGGDALEKAGVEPLVMADLDMYTPTDVVAYTYGWPNGMRRMTAGRRHTHASLSPTSLQWFSTNPVRPGDSGGPLFNSEGRVLGVVSSGMAQAGQRHVLSEELCIATDPRPALQQLRWTAKPRRLTSWWRDDMVAQAPYTLARLWLGRSKGERLAARALYADRMPAHISDPELHFLTGALLQLQGDASGAKAAYEQTLILHEGHFAAAYSLGVHHLRARRPVHAHRYFAQARQSPAYRHLATYGMAQAQMGRLMYRQAVASLLAVLRYDGAFGPALFDLALCYWALDDAVRLEQVRFKLEQQHPYWAKRLRLVLEGHGIPPIVLEAPSLHIELRRNARAR
ncbi:MAG: trypsin-like peptidase domain-containing protein [Bacteroidota bacterium]